MEKKYSFIQRFISLKFLKVLLPLVLAVSAIPATAADYYWVGGAGNWTDVNHWSLTSGGSGGAGVPAIADNAYFNASSGFISTSNTVTINLAAQCNNMDWTGVTNYPTFTGAQTLKIYGSLTLSPNMAFSVSGAVYFEATTTGKTINTGGITTNTNIYLNGIGGDWTLGSDLYCSTLYHANGTLRTNNYNVSCYAYASSYTVTRGLYLGSSTFTVRSQSFAVNADLYTLSAGTSLISIGSSNSYPLTISYTTAANTSNLVFNNIEFTNGGNCAMSNSLPATKTVTFNNVSFASPASITNNNCPQTFGGMTITNTITISSTNSSNTIGGSVIFPQAATLNGNIIFNGDVTLTTGKTYTFQAAKTCTFNGNLTANGYCGNAILIQSGTPGSKNNFTKASGSVTLNYVTLKDNNATTGGATFTANNATATNCTGWTVNAPTNLNQPYYWIGGAGNWSQASHWSTTSGGTPNIDGCIPGLTNDVFFDANSGFTPISNTVTIDVVTAECKNMDWTGVVNYPTFTGANTLKVYSSMTLSPNMTFSVSGAVYFEATTTGKIINTAGITTNTNFYLNGIGGDWTLGNELYCSTLYHANGTFRTNNFNVSCYAYASSYTVTRGLYLGSSTFTVRSQSFAVNADLYTLSAGTSLISIGSSNSYPLTISYTTAANTSNLVFNNIEFTNGGNCAMSNSLPATKTVTFNNVSFASPASITNNNCPQTFGAITLANTITISSTNSSNTIGGNILFPQAATLNGTITFNGNVTFTSGKTYTFQAAKTCTFNGNLTANGYCGNAILIQSGTPGSKNNFTKASGTVTLNYVTLKDNNATTGGATFTANNSTATNCTGWTVNAPTNLNQPYYWIGGAGNWSQASHWSNTSGGTPNLDGCIPGLTNDVYFDANSGFTPISNTVTIDVVTAECKNMDWTGVTNYPTFTGANTLKVYSSMALSPNMTFSVSGAVYFEATTTGKTINTAGITTNTNFYLNGIGGDWTLGNELYCSTLYHANGTFRTNNFNVSCYAYASSYTVTRGLYLGSSTFTVRSQSFAVNADLYTLSAGTSLISIGSSNSYPLTISYTTAANTSNLVFNNIEFTNGGNCAMSNSLPATKTVTFNNVSFASPASITNNNCPQTFSGMTIANTITISSTNSSNTINGNVTFPQNATLGGNITFNGNVTLSPAMTYTFQAAKTFTFNGSLTGNGLVGQLINIVSGTPGTRANFSKSSGCVALNYASIKDNNATGGAGFYATNSTNVSNNAGWTFGAAPGTVGPMTATTSVNPGNTICAGTNVTFTTSVTNGGLTPSYQWKLNGGNVGTSISTYTNSGLANGDQVWCVVTSSNPCSTNPTSTTTAIVMTVPSSVPVSCSISANQPTTICSNTNITFTCSPVNGGYTPTYQWKVNGANVGTNAPTYTSGTWNFGDQVSCILTSSLGSCTTNNPATSNTIALDVNVVLPVSVSISANPGTSISAGTNVVFTATPVNGGGNPTYRWIVDGSVVSTSGSTYSSMVLLNGNNVSCEITSNLGSCLSGNPAMSNTLTMSVTGSLDFYWVGGSGNWSDGANHWAVVSGGTPTGLVPGSTNNVYFDANSGFTTPSRTVTVDASVAACKNMDWTGALSTPTFTTSNSVYQLKIYGSITLIPAMTYSFNGPVYFEATSTGKTINMANKSFNNDIFFNGLGGGWTLQSNMSSSYNVYIYYGSFYSNDKSITCRRLWSDQANVRTINLGSSLITINDNQCCDNGVNMNCSNLTLSALNSTFMIAETWSGNGIYCYNLTSNVTFGNVTFTNNGYINNGSGTYRIIFGDVSFMTAGAVSGLNTFNNLSFASTGTVNGNAIINNNATFTGQGTIGGNSTINGTCSFNTHASINGNNTFNNISFKPGSTYTFAASSTQSITGTLTASAGCGNNIVFKSSSSGTKSNLSKVSGTVDCYYLSLQDQNTTGGATFNAWNSTVISNVSGWNVTTPGGSTLDYYWIGGTGNWSDGAHWSTVSGDPAFSTGCIPGSGNNVFFDANSGFTSSNKTVTIDVSTASCKSMDWTGALSTPTFTTSNSAYQLKIYGSLTLIPAMTYSFNGPVYFEATATGKTINMANKSFNNDIFFNGLGGGWTLQSNLSSSYNVYIYYGSFYSNDKSITCRRLWSDQANARTINLGSSLITINDNQCCDNGVNMNCSNLTLSALNSTFMIAETWSGNGIYCYNLTSNVTFGNVTFTNNGYVNNGSGTYRIIFGDVSFMTAGAVSGLNTFNNLSFASTGTVNGNAIINNNLIFTGQGTIGGNSTVNGTCSFNTHASINGNNTFNNITFKPGSTYTFAASSTQSITGTVTASAGCGNNIVFKSSSSGTKSNLSKLSGTIDCYYLSLQDQNTTGGATFNAWNSTVVSNVSGWNVTAPGASTVDYYWIGGSGNWSDGAHWSTVSGDPAYSSGCIPGSGNNVFFDANSGFTSSNKTVTVDVSTASCNSMDWTGALATPTFTTSNSAYQLKIYGSMTLIPTMTFSFNGPVYFEATTTGKSINMANKSFNNDIFFNGLGGGWTLQSNLSSSYNVYIYYGSFYSNDKSITCRRLWSDQANVRTINLGSSLITINDNQCCDNGVNMNCSNLTLSALNSTFMIAETWSGNGIYCYNLTSNVTFGNVTFTNNGYINNGSGTYRMIFGDVSFNTAGAVSGLNTFSNLNFASSGTVNGNNIIANDLTFTGVGTIGGNSIINGNCTFNTHGTISGTNTFNNLTLKPGCTYTFASNATQTITGTLTATGSSGLLITMNSSSTPTQATFSKSSGCVILDYVALRDMKALGGASWYTGSHNTNNGNNTGWTWSNPVLLGSLGSVNGPLYVCYGSTGNDFFINPVTGATGYTWTVPAGATITAGQNTNYITVDFGTASSGDVTVTAYNNCSTSSPSSRSVTVYPLLTPSVSITAGLNPVCGGTSVTFTASPVNGGTSPFYQWMVNNLDQGVSTGTFTYTPVNNDVVNCLLISNATCATPNIATSQDITMTVNICQMSWTGAVDSSWSNPGNWSGGIIPLNYVSVSIDAAALHMPVIDLPGATCDSLFIEAGASLSIAGTNSLEIFDNWDCQGSFMPGNGAVRCKGNITFNNHLTSVQFHDLIIDTLSSISLAGTAIDVSGDFINHGSFIPNSNRVRFNGNSQQLINHGAAQFYDLEFANTTTGNTDIVLMSDLTFTHAAVFTNGIVDGLTHGAKLIVPDNATCTEGNAGSFFNGIIVKQGDDAFIFPTGAGGVWAPLGIDAPAPASDLAAQYFAATFAGGVTNAEMCSGSGLDHASAVEYWDVTTNNAHPQITLYWKNGSYSGVSALSLIEFAHWEDCSGIDKWANKTDSRGGTASSGWVKSAGLTSYSPFTLGFNGSGPLPVDLVSFDASCNGNEVNLEWQTASETNSDYFIVASSTDMEQWKNLGKIPAAGNSNQLKTYNLSVTDPGQGEVYYRLQQFDYNGASHLYGAIGKSCGQYETTIELFPNPNNGNFVIVSGDKIDGISLIEIYNMTGQLVYSETADDLFTREIKLHDYTTGVYYARIISEDKSRIIRFVMNK